MGGGGDGLSTVDPPGRGQIIAVLCTPTVEDGGQVLSSPFPLQEQKSTIQLYGTAYRKEVHLDILLGFG